jgi:hypothetical protein
LRKETHQFYWLCDGVLNALGLMILENPYENALAVGVGPKRIPLQQPRFVSSIKRLKWENTFLINSFESVVVDTKTIDKIPI